MTRPIGTLNASIGGKYLVNKQTIPLNFLCFSPLFSKATKRNIKKQLNFTVKAVLLIEFSVVFSSIQ